MNESFAKINSWAALFEAQCNISNSKMHIKIKTLFVTEDSFCTKRFVMAATNQILLF